MMFGRKKKLERDPAIAASRLIDCVNRMDECQADVCCFALVHIYNGFSMFDDLKMAANTIAAEAEEYAKAEDEIPQYGHALAAFYLLARSRGDAGTATCDAIAELIAKYYPDRTNKENMHFFIGFGSPRFGTVEDMFELPQLKSITGLIDKRQGL